jgi:arylsulfatase A-like enzyme
MIINRFILLIPILWSLASGCLDAAEGARPNIVYLLTDQWRASATGYAGDPNVKTPHLDRLAGTSLHFRNAVSVCPVCTPYRAALMTGRFPTSTGMFLNDAHLPDEEKCMAEILGEAGYDTAYIGKWHLDGHGRTAFIPRERRQGWDYWKAAECEHHYNHSHYYSGDSPEKQYWEGYDAFAQTEDARQYLRDHAGAGKPFILCIAYGGPHFPHHTAPEEFKKLYPPDGIKLPPNVPANMQAKARVEAQGYYAHCTALDRCVGELLETLEETGLMKNTIIVFTSDHGEMLGSQNIPPTLKQVAWSESAQVPFLLRVPGTAGRALTTPITTPDILPTLLGLAGVGIPSTIEGEDLSPIIRSGGEPERAALYMNVAPFIQARFTGEYRAIRTNRHTYVRGIDGPWMVFDDVQDPWQMHNLVGQPDSESLVKQLDQQLQDRLKKIGDGFRPARESIEEWGYRGIAPNGSVPYSDVNAHPQTPRRKKAEQPAN